MKCCGLRAMAMSPSPKREIFKRRWAQRVGVGVGFGVGREGGVGGVVGLAWLGFVVDSTTLALMATIFIYSRA